MEREEYKNRMFVVVPLLLIGLIFILGAAYAWLTTVLGGSQSIKIKGGSLQLMLDDSFENNEINLLNTIPLSDIDGKKTKSYKFDVINNGEEIVEYELYLDDEKLNTSDESIWIDDQYIKYSLQLDSTEVSSNLLFNASNRLLYSNTLSAKDTDSYELKLWIDSEATVSEVASKIFRGKLRLEGIQSE